ncbi:MAG: hypothetical protein ACBZ72_06010 [Candidatus Bathyarchaeia archaeon]|jgi:hypothetical protein
MKKKTLQVTAIENELLVDVTFYKFPADLLKDFTLLVAKRYYAGSLTAAVKDLMQQAVSDQEFMQEHVRPQ